MDWNIGAGLATLIAIDDGTVSMYLNPGGGIIGAGTRPDVAQIAERFRAEASRQRHLFRPSVDYPPPGADSVTFFLLTDSQTLTSGAIASRDLRQPTHALSALGTLAQQLLSAVRNAR